MSRVQVVEDKDCWGLIDQIRNMAAKDFANHVLTKRDGYWYCADPGTSIYSFSLCFSIPYYIFLAGDIGELVLTVTGKDSFRWLRGCVDSLDYVLGKARHPHQDFMKVSAEQAIKDLEEENPKQAQSLRQEWEGLTSQYLLSVCLNPAEQLAWYDAWGYTVGDGESPECVYWSSQMLWQYFALRKFVELYKQHMIDLRKDTL